MECTSYRENSCFKSERFGKLDSSFYKFQFACKNISARSIYICKYKIFACKREESVPFFLGAVNTHHAKRERSRLFSEFGGFYPCLDHFKSSRDIPYTRKCKCRYLSETVSDYYIGNYTFFLKHFCKSCFYCKKRCLCTSQSAQVLFDLFIFRISVNMT